MLKRFSLILVMACCIASSLGAIYDVTDFYTDYKKVLVDMYQGVDAIIPQEERDACSATGGSPVYGEILYESCALLISELKLTDQDVFYDLGSGLGKFVSQVYLTSPVKKAWGIEFSENRFERAQKATANLIKIQETSFEFENKMRKVFGKDALVKTKKKKFGFTNMDMLQADLSDATVVFTCSTCFGQEFMQKLTDKLAANNGLRILTLVQLPYHKHVHYVNTYVLPMTWSAETPVYSYIVDQGREAEAPKAAQAELVQEEIAAPVVTTQPEERVDEQNTPDATLNFDVPEEDATPIE